MNLLGLLLLILVGFVICLRFEFDSDYSMEMKEMKIEIISVESKREIYALDHLLDHLDK